MADPDAAAPTTPPLARRWSWVVLVATLLVFGPATLGGFAWDDRLLISANRGVREPSHLVALFNTGFWDVSMTLGPRVEARYYRPLTALAYAVQLQVFRGEARSFHRVSLALHLACVLLAMRWLHRRLSRAGFDGVRAAAGSLLAGGAFALHPTRPESVSWISGSTDLWAALWCLLALEEWDRGPALRHVALCAALLFFAVLSKESALVVPALLLVDAWADDTWRRPAVRRAWALVTAPMAAAWMVRVVWFPLRDPMSLHEPVTTAAARVLASVGHLARLVALPWPLSVLPAPARFDAAGSFLYAPWAVAVGALVVALFAALTATASRRPAWRPWCADAAWFLVALVPVANVIPLRLYTLVAPRFLYLPMLGVGALAARAVATTLARRPHWRPWVFAAAALTLVTWGVASLEHAEHFRSTEDLWTHELRVHPEDPIALGQLAQLPSRRGRDEGLSLALRAYHGALAQGIAGTAAESSLLVAARLSELTPDADQETLSALRRFYDGFTPDARGAAVLDATRARLRVPLSDEARGPRSPLAWRVPRAAVYARTLDLESARRQLDEALALTPRDPAAWRVMLVVLISLERWDDAVELCERFRGANAPEHQTATRCEAVPAARELARTPPADPVEAAVLRADRAAGVGAFAVARRTLNEVIAAHPDRAEPRGLLGRIEVRERQYDRGIELLRAAQRIAPDAALARDIARAEAARDAARGPPHDRVP